MRREEAWSEPTVPVRALAHALLLIFSPLLARGCLISSLARLLCH